MKRKEKKREKTGESWKTPQSRLLIFPLPEEKDFELSLSGGQRQLQ